jgi:iron-sulfur cluster assembly accessory protein
MIAITPAAAVHLLTLLAAHEAVPSNHASGYEDAPPPEATKTSQDGLRILVEKGGCAGMQYAMKLDLRQEGDVLSEAGGARVFMDPASAALLRGAELDYCDDLVGTGFRLQNPNAARSCGCGTSFEPATEPAAPEPGGHSSAEEHSASLAHS